MASPAKPTILVIHGGWHPPACYQLLLDELTARGHAVLCPALPSLGPDARGKTLTDDVALIRETVRPLFERGEEVVIVGHSYGGVPACAATRGLGVAERAAAAVGGVSGAGGRGGGGFRSIVYLAGLTVPQKGMDIRQAAPGPRQEWQDASEPYVKGQLMTVNEKSKQAFYNDLPEEEAQKWFDMLLPHSSGAFETPVDYVAADLTIPKGYLICEFDQALPPEVQELIVASIPGFKVERIGASHSPFLSMPEECATKLISLFESM